MTSSFDVSPSSNIVFECNDTRNNSGLILLKQRKDPDKFKLHLHNGYIIQSIAMVIDIKDFAKMFESLEDYFLNTQIEESNE